jgi:outer membrane protein TolC
LAIALAVSTRFVTAAGAQLQVDIRPDSLLLEIPAAQFDFMCKRYPSPERLVIDVEGRDLDLTKQVKRLFAGDGKLVQRVRLGSVKPGSIRLVVDLAQAAEFHAARVAGRSAIEVRFGKSPAISSRVMRLAPPDEAPTPSAPKRKAEEPARVQRAAYRPRQQEPQQPERTAQEAVPPVRKFELPARVGILNDAPLSLAEAIFMAINNNREIQAYRIDREDAGLRVGGAKGVFEPVFSNSASFRKAVQPVSNTLGGSTTGSVFERIWQVTPSLSGASPRMGGSYEVSFLSQRYTTNNSFATLNPNYPSALSFQYIQPLWKSLRYDSRRHTIAVARKNQQLADETFRRKVMELIDRTEFAYWELSFARRDLAVQLEALQIAKLQDETNRRQLSLGQMAAIEVVAAQTQLTNFELSVYTAQDALTRAENNLKALMLGERSASLWASALIPSTEPENSSRLPALGEAVSEALAARPEAAEVRMSAEINDANVKLSREQLKPQLDLVGRYTLSGLAGADISGNSTNPSAESFGPALLRLNQLSAIAGLPSIGFAPAAPAPGMLVGGYGTSLNRLFGADFPTSMIELRFTLPLGNRTAKANLALAVTEGRRIEHRKHAVEQSIEAEVRNAIQSIDSARQRLQAARIKLQSAEEQFRSEDRRFQKAASTLFLVQQRQLTMVTSRSQVLRAETDLSEALARFDYVRGMSADRHKVVIK